MIEVDNLTKRYGRETAVSGVSFKVQKGEILGFLGPNGAGKTTTMRVLSCYLPPTEGTARVAGFDVFDDPIEVKRHVGYLPEAPPLYPDMEVDTFLDFVSKIKGIPSAQRQKRIDESIGKCALGDVRGKLIGRLSKGYRQRVGLAQAILAAPDVLILDEPTAGLDPKQIIETRELIKSLGGDHTVILSTHILPEVEMTCGRVLIINKGRVVAEDTPSNLTHRLRGTGTLRVEVKGQGDAVLDLLRVVPGVAAVRSKGDASGAGMFEVDVQPGRDCRADLARAVVQKGFDLLALHEVSMSLEEIFLSLTTTDAARPDETREHGEVSA
jgi:ABC-2 type transport system ATP-binding protein